MHINLAIDLQHLDQAVFVDNILVPLLRFNGAIIDLTYVDGPPFAEALLRGSAALDTLNAHARLLREQNGRKLDELLDLIPQDNRGQVHHLYGGIPEKRICQVSVDHDLLAVSAHGRTGLDRLLLGSSAETVVVHSPIPVLVLHPW